MLANFGEPDFHTRVRVGRFHLFYSKRPDVRVDCYRHPHPWERWAGALRLCKDVEASSLAQGVRQCAAGSPKYGSMLLCDDGGNAVLVPERPGDTQRPQGSAISDIYCDSTPTVGLIAQNSPAQPSCAVGPREPTTRLSAGYCAPEIKAPRSSPPPTAGMSVGPSSSCRRDSYLLAAYAIGGQGTASVVGLGLVSFAGRTPPGWAVGDAVLGIWYIVVSMDGRGWRKKWLGDEEVAHDPA